MLLTAHCLQAFEDRRDAEDAVYDRDGYRFDRERLRVELARDDRRGDRGRDDRKPKRTPYSVTVTGLPERASWQDLKDFMRCGGDIVYADVDRRGGGVVEYSNKEDMLYAVKKNDGAEFDMSYGRSVVTCKAADVDDRSPSRGRSRSYDSRDRKPSRRSPSRSVSRSRSPSRERDSKPVSSRDRSPSRSRSRSPRSERSRSRSR